LSQYILLAAGAWAVAAATPAAAQTLRIAVGPLTTPEDARALDRRIDAAAARFCSARGLDDHLTEFVSCRAAVREEALSQLSPAQQVALAQGLRSPRRLSGASPPPDDRTLR
jgi:UrcA family protein